SARQNDELLFDRFFSEFAKMLDDVFRGRNDDAANFVASGMDANEGQANVVGAQQRAVGVLNLWRGLRGVAVPNLQVVRRSRCDNKGVDELAQQPWNAFALGWHDAPRPIAGGCRQSRRFLQQTRDRLSQVRAIRARLAGQPKGLAEQRRKPPRYLSAGRKIARRRRRN
ncbi:MAG TPA: hypothetical protein VFW87_22190, partial [Pirellulales bacterium]|nr:hypothetical protein [Pirellulales bacterium]